MVLANAAKKLRGEEVRKRNRGIGGGELVPIQSK